MSSPRNILGMNARVQIYTAQNPPEAKRYGFSKLRAKIFLAKHGVSVPTLYAQIESSEDLREFDWHTIDGSFAVKPASGSAGKGILVFQGFDATKDAWLSVNGNYYTEDDLNLHVSDILSGQYSTWGTKHMALIEERIPIHPDLENYAQLGTPDVRVIMYHRIPVMCMARIPTEASGGRANLDLGAIGLGIDLGTGKSLYAVSGKKKMIKYFPHNHLPVAGIQIPYWNDVLATAVRAANATGLEFCGADIFLHPTKGPMIAEINSFPGLSIQLCNRDGLRQRLERVDGIQARNVAHAVKIGRALFAENYGASPGDVDRPIIDFVEDVVVVSAAGENISGHQARVDTGRFRSAISEKLVEELGLTPQTNILWSQHDEEEGKVPVIEITIKMKNKTITTHMTVSKKLNRRAAPIELGRRDLQGFFISGE
jgi:alpha-L-glutamate ligase-like protein